MKNKLVKIKIPNLSGRELCSIYEYVQNDHYLIRDFLARQKQSSVESYNKIVARLSFVIHNGLSFNNEQQCKRLKGKLKDRKIFEFRAKAKGGQNVRIFAFEDCSEIIVCFCAINKKTDNLSQVEQDRICRLHDDYQAAKKGNRLEKVD